MPYSTSELNSRIAACRCMATSPKMYFVGYDSGSPKFIETKQRYRCVDFLSARLRSWQQSTKDIHTEIIGLPEEFEHGQKDLFGLIKGSEYGVFGGISTSIAGVYCQALSPKGYFIGYENGVPRFIETKQRYRCVDFLSANISSVYSRDLSAYILALFKASGTDDLGAYVRSMIRAHKNLPVFLNALTYEGLPAKIFPIPPIDLPGYLKVWPMAHLPGRIHGWQTADLGAAIDWNDMRQLPGYIGIHPPKDLPTLIKGWVREAVYDLGAFIRAFQYEDLGAIIRGTYLENLPAYLFCIEPENLSGSIHGWQELDLSSYIIGKYGPNDLQAYINITGEPRDLPAYLKTVKAREMGKNLPAYLNPATILMQQSNLSALVAAHSPGNLMATLIPSGSSRDLSAFIRPKIVYMTTLLSVSTMEHSDLGAVINFICRGSGFKNLGATIDFSYLANLAASITGKKFPSYQADLGSTVGYAPNYLYTDRVPVSLTVGTGYNIEDKIPIFLSVYKQQAYLYAMISGTYRYTDMGATITPTWLEEYEFKNVKTKQLVYDINHARQINWYEVVQLYFKSIVNEYFYVGAANKLYKTDKTDRWILEIASFVPENVVLNIRRKLHRMKNIYDLTKFDNMDQAIRFAINYVTSYDYGDLMSSITATGLPYTPKSFITENEGLTASISPQYKTFVLGYNDKVEFISN